MGTGERQALGVSSLSWGVLLLLLVIPTLALIALAVWWLWWALGQTSAPTSGSTPSDARLLTYRRQLQQLSFPEAKEQAERILRHDNRFITHPAGAPAYDRRSMLGPTLQAFFHRYDEVVGRDEYIRRAEIAPCPDNPAYLRIGQDGRGAQLVARPGEDRIIVLSGEDLLDDDEHEETYPSIYHWMLRTVRRYELEGE